MKMDNKKSILGMSVFGIFLILVVAVFCGWTQVLDETIVTNFPRTEVLTSIMKAITFLGEGTTLVLIGVLVVLFIKRKREGASLLVCLGLVAEANALLKLVVRRPRPFIKHLVAESGFSFPSGHSASSMAFYGYLIYMVYKKCKNKMLRNVLIIILSIVILAIGISRIYLGVHYPSDVLGGFTFGLTILLFYTKFTDWIWSK